MSLTRSWITVADEGFPRVSGDEPNFRSTWDHTNLFSPRERG